MKLRLDEYYAIISEEWVDIESYMPEDMEEEFEKFRESHTQDEIYNYLENLYSHIEVINNRYNINDIDLEKAYIDYTAIIKIKDKYYSFDWHDTWHWNFEDKVDANADVRSRINPDRSRCHLADCNNIRELLRAHPIITGYYFPLNHGEHRITSSKSKEPDLKKHIE